MIQTLPAAAATGSAVRGVCAIGRNRAFNDCATTDGKFDRATTRTTNCARALTTAAAECGGLIENAVTISTKRIAAAQSAVAAVSRACAALRAARFTTVARAGVALKPAPGQIDRAAGFHLEIVREGEAQAV